MKVHEFELSGRFAHWRRIYTNSSSLSYLYPTRTNIIGMISSVLKKGYDSYYEEFNKENLNVSVAINSNIVKKTMLFNYRSKKTGITQTRCEILTNSERKLKYNIYLQAKNEKIEKTLQEFIDKIKLNQFGYGIYLGQRQHKGYLDYIGSFSFKIKDTKVVNSICLRSDVNGTFIFNDREYNSDLIPLEFDKKRNLIYKAEYVIEKNLNEIKVDGKINDVYVLENGQQIKWF